MGILIAYRLKKPHDPNTASALVKKLYGQETSSHGGKYSYRREGLLDTMPSRKLIRGVLILREEDKDKDKDKNKNKDKDKDKVVELLEDFDTEIHVREGVLTAEDINVLDLE